VLSSENALRDLSQSHLQNTIPTYILRFASLLKTPSDQLLSRSELMKKYKISRSWFHIPNQFWVHKNHKLVIDALSILKSKNKCPLVITTGNTQDYRNPSYFSSLMNLVTENNLEHEFRILGMVPYEDVVALMKYSTAVINPSRFEGWSTTVEESKALGKTIILSDIPVHREQDPQYAHYFDVNSVDQLAKCMEFLEGSFNEAPINLQHVATDKKEAVLAFAEQYENIVLKVINGAKKNLDEGISSSSIAG